MLIVKDTPMVKCKKTKQNSCLPFPEGHGSTISCSSSQTSSRSRAHRHTQTHSCTQSRRYAHTHARRLTNTTSDTIAQTHTELHGYTHSIQTHTLLHKQQAWGARTESHSTEIHMDTCLSTDMQTCTCAHSINCSH